MTAQIAPLPVQKFWDNNGNPLYNGLLYTYAAGTTTPQATYTDSTQATPNANPVVLNARGEANVWLNPSLAYKLVLTDQSGNGIWTVDQIQGLIATQQQIGLVLYPLTLAEIAASVTPVNFAYPAGYVRRYGAVGDGVTDDEVAINKAGSIGIPVYFDKGTFLIKTVGATFSSSVYGVGMGQSIIISQIDGSNHVLPITFNGSNIEVSGLTIKGSSYLANNSGAALVNLGGTSGSHATNVIMRDCEVTQATSFAVYCIYTDGFLFTGNHVHDTGADGIHLGVCTDVRILANRFNACVDDLIALTSLGGAANQNQNVVVDGNFCGMTNTGISRCILLESLVDARIVNNICYRTSGSLATNGMIELVRVSSGNANANVTFQGNICVNSAANGDGIFVYGGSSQIRVLDNYLSGAGAGVNSNAFTFGTIDHLEISGNTCISSASSGINVPSTTVGTTLKITRNKINSFTNGIATNTNATYNLISDNDVTYNGQNSTNTGIGANPSTGGQLMRNIIAQSGGVTSGTNVSVGSNILVRENVGWVTEASGSITVATGGTVTHGINGTPNQIFLQPTGGTPTNVFPSAVGGTTFTINFTGGGSQGFMWSAKLTDAF